MRHFLCISQLQARMTSATIILDKSTVVILINATTLMDKSTLSTKDFGNNPFGQSTVVILINATF